MRHLEVSCLALYRTGHLDDGNIEIALTATAGLPHPLPGSTNGRYDDEFARNGVNNLSMIFTPLAGVAISKLRIKLIKFYLFL
jgi:hypothetical protein